MNDQQRMDLASRIGKLLHKFLNREIDDAELEELRAWAFTNKENEKLFNDIAFGNELEEPMNYLMHIDTESAFEDVMQKTGLKPKKVFGLTAQRWKYLSVAASVLLITSVATLLYLKSNKKEAVKQPGISKTYQNDAAPGGNVATLTLEDGSRVALDKAGNGILSHQGGSTVLKLDNGQLAYRSADTKGNTIGYNVISTPKGGQYSIELPDGSKVWMNAESSLKYPTAFTGKERVVELDGGEAYFEIAKHHGMPFVVKVHDVSINVLGTSFNVMAYPDETTLSTTLVDGAIRVNEGSFNRILKPADQVDFLANGETVLKKEVNVQNTIAWTKGYFSFDKADLKSVLRQLSRWYNVDVEYTGEIPSQKFEGKIQKNLRLSQVLDILTMNQVHFKIEGNKLMIMP